MVNSQDPPKVAQDSTHSVAVREADSIYIYQMIAKVKLDSIYEVKKNKL